MLSNPSEALASKHIEAAFKRSFEHVHIFNNIVIPLPDGRRVKTAEMDCVVVCEGGVFVFEVKGWERTYVGRVAVPGAEKKQWVLKNPDGRVFNVCDPIVQGVEKMVELRKRLPTDLLVQNFVLVTGDEVELSGSLPSSTLLLTDLPFLARMVRTNAKRSKKSNVQKPDRVAAIVDALKQLASLHSLDQHVAAVVASKEARAQASHAPANAPGLVIAPNRLSCWTKDCELACEAA